MKIRLEKNESEMQKVTRLLSGCSEAIPSVFSNAMNRAAEQGRTAAIRCVTKEYTVKARPLPIINQVQGFSVLQPLT